MNRIVSIIALIQLLSAFFSLNAIFYKLSINNKYSLEVFSYVVTHLAIMLLTILILIGKNKYQQLLKWSLVPQMFIFFLDEIASYCYYTPLQLSIGIKFEAFMKIFFDFNFGMNNHWSIGLPVEVNMVAVNLLPVILFGMLENSEQINNNNNKDLLDNSF